MHDSDTGRRLTLKLKTLFKSYSTMLGLELGEDCIVLSSYVAVPEQLLSVLLYTSPGPGF
jgi:hypothetical protein